MLLIKSVRPQILLFFVLALACQAKSNEQSAEAPTAANHQDAIQDLPPAIAAAPLDPSLVAAPVAVAPVEAVVAPVAFDPLAPTFVLMSGNNSCKKQASLAGIDPSKDPMFKYLNALIAQAQAETGVAMNFITSCFIADSDELLVFYSGAPNEQKRIKESEFAGLIMALNPSQLYITGHSYGGWLALRVASEISQARRIQGFFTIDPISANLCKKYGDPGCQRFPQDFTEDELIGISHQSDIWLNFYQRVTPVLRSGPTPFATTSVRVSNVHWLIDSNEKVWSDISGAVMTGLAR